MNEPNKLDMSGHNCALCEAWNATHHSRFPTTPIQPSEGEMLLIVGFMKGAEFNGNEMALCEKHQVVLNVLVQRLGKRQSLPQAEEAAAVKLSEIDELIPSLIPIPKQQPVFGEPITVPCPKCGAAIGRMCKIDNPGTPTTQAFQSWGFHEIRIQTASPETGSKVEGPGDVTPGP